jgi:hypothetical protein
MNHLKSFNELVKNPILLKSYLRNLLSEINKIYKIGKDNIKFESENPVYYKLLITGINSKLSDNICNILDKYKSVLYKNDIVLSYKHYLRGDFKIGDDLEMIPTGDNYSEYLIYLKNIHTRRIKPNRFVYHYAGKDDRIRDEIIKNGLTTKSHSKSNNWSSEIYLEYPNAIFAVNSKDKWRDGHIFKIDTIGLKNKWWEDLNFNNRKDLIMTFENIPPSNIEYISYEKIQ